MIPCASIETKLTQYLFGELPVDELAPVEEHLETCESCERLFLSLQETILQVQPESDEAGLDDARYDAVVEHAVEVAAGVRRRRLVRALVLIAVGLLLAGLAGWLALGRPARSGGILAPNGGDSVSDVGQSYFVPEPCRRRLFAILPREN